MSSSRYINANNKVYRKEKWASILIRTNDVNNLEKFERIIKRLEHSYPYKKDKLVIDCHNENNCVTVAIDLINSGITNLDLGLFQINYNSFPENLYTYFNEQYWYRNACKAVISKNVNVNVKQSGENKKAKIEKEKLYAKK